MSCAACSCALLPDEDSLLCALDECGKVYHLLCAGGKTSSYSTGTWVCPECRCKTKKGGDNSHTPVGNSKKGREPNVTYRKKLHTAQVDSISDISISAPVPGTERFHQDQSDLSYEIRGLREEISTLRDQLSAAMTVIMSLESKVECYGNHVLALHTKIEQNQANSRCVNDHLPRRVVTTPVGGAGASPATLVPNNKVQRQNKQDTDDSLPLTTRLPTKVVLTNPELSAATGSKPVGVISSEIDTTAARRAADLNDQQPWTVVKKKSRRPPSLCGTAGPAVTSLKAVEARSYIHLWNMASSAEEIRDYLRQLCPVGTCTVEELTPRGDYKSYKLGVPTAFCDTCLSTEIWPVNARIKTWITYRQSVGPGKIMKKNNQPFRGPAASQ